MKNVLTVLILLTLGFTGAHAQEEGKWEVILSNVVWMPAVDGEFRESGLQTQVEASQSSRLDHISPGGEFMVEFIKERLTVALQSQYTKVLLDAETATPIGDIPGLVRARRFLVEYWVGYDVTGAEDHWLEVIAGGRHVRLNLNGENILGTSASEIDNNDPLIGVRMGKQVTDKLTLETVVTASGFGATSRSSDRTTESRFVLEYDLSDRFSIMAGYRRFKTKFATEKFAMEQYVAYETKGVFVGGAYKVK